MPAIAATAPRATAVAETSAAGTRTPHQHCAPRQDDDKSDRCEATHRRGNPLVSAMMSALASLMPGTPARADSQSGASPSADLKSSAEAFAHELFDALRGSSGGRGRALGHGHHHHGEARGYDGLAQRLDRLASQVDATAATTTTSTTTVSASLSTASFSASVDDDSASAELSMTTLQVDITQQTTTAGTASESPLQAAFRKLFQALRPAESTAPSDHASASSASGLSAFLRQLADALRNGSGADDHTMAPGTGGLLSLAA